MNWKSLNLYRILELSPEASPVDIKKAFRRLAFKCHPDHNPGDTNAAKRFQMVTLAYEVLVDPKKRQLYDEVFKKRYNHGRRSNTNKGEGYYESQDGLINPYFDTSLRESVLAQYFGINSSRSVLTRGVDLCYYLQIERATANRGGTEPIQYSRMIFCEKCHGNGLPFSTDGDVCMTCNGNGFREEKHQLVVNIPPGTHDGDRLCYKFLGDQNFYGMPPGDLVVVIKVC